MCRVWLQIAEDWGESIPCTYANLFAPIDIEIGFLLKRKYVCNKI